MRRLSLIFSAALLSACMTQQGLPPEQRPQHWAQPVQMHGVPNLFQVSSMLYRSAQPLPDGLTMLNQQPSIKTIVSLRAGRPDAAIVPPTGVKYVQIEFNTWQVKDQDVLQFLKIATDPAQQPVLLHCKHGADRTGMMTAIYRIVVQNWRKADAIAEMRQGGFGYHPVWFNLIRYIEDLDVPAWQAKLAT
ncbi:MAG: fused DSP-PTPase phosphatase/NAD kinase-like protein [Formosimonas sp.]